MAEGAWERQGAGPRHETRARTPHRKGVTCIVCGDDVADPHDPRCESCDAKARARAKVAVARQMRDRVA